MLHLLSNTKLVFYIDNINTVMLYCQYKVVNNTPICYHLPQKGGMKMPNFACRLKQLRTKNKITQKELAKFLNVSQNAIFNWENGKREPSIDTISKIANHFKVSTDYLMGLNTTALPKKKGVVINILGRIAAGIPVEAVEEIIDTEEISEEMARTGTFFGLKIKGDSMTPGICDGDVVIVKKQPDAENGEIVIATVNGTDAVCKRLRKYREGIELISNNPSYAPMEFSNKDISDLPVCIIGKVVELRRKF